MGRGVSDFGATPLYMVLITPGRGASLCAVRLSVRDAHRPKTAPGLLCRVFSRLLLLVLCGIYTLPGLHFVAVAHAVCAEHGTLEHVHEAGVAASVEPSNGAVSVVAASADEHDCCGALGIRTRIRHRARRSACPAERRTSELRAEARSAPLSCSPDPYRAPV
jgi:hypothetical protein